MLYIIRFHDKPNMQDIREKFMKAHLAWIEENRSFVLLAGSLRDAPGHPAQGGLWVVDAADKNEIINTIKDDPFWANGIRQGADIHFWGMASDDMKKLPEILRQQ